MVTAIQIHANKATFVKEGIGYTLYKDFKEAVANVDSTVKLDREHYRTVYNLLNHYPAFGSREFSDLQVGDYVVRRKLPSRVCQVSAIRKNKVTLAYYTKKLRIRANKTVDVYDLLLWQPKVHETVFYLKGDRLYIGTVKYMTETKHYYIQGETFSDIVSLPYILPIMLPIPFAHKKEVKYAT